MATEATTTKFQNSDFRPVPQPPDFHPGGDLSPHDGLHFWQFMIAGSIAGCVEHMAMFPVDTVKTRMQALGSCPIKSVGVGHALRSIVKSEGLAGFYRGIGAMGLGAGPAHAVYFSVYEVSKKYFSGGNPNNSAAHAVSGVFATVTSDAVLTPMDMVKQRLQLGNSAAYRGVLDCVKKVLKEEGFGAFYASYRTTVLMNAPFTAVHFATYEAAKRGLIEISPESADDERVIVHATAGAFAGASAAVITTPLDVVKTQLQCQGVCGCDRFKSSSISEVIKTIVQKDGYRGLMRGWIPRMLFHAPAAAICWSTYEAGKSFFQELNDSTESGTVT
ncbi:PREDICTED: mitoferrin [Theobroma cacao]|uniref:Mitoferrin n=1 Tax=Theobroma cacao TaxID=3641 RepID=A0AB32UTV4_THECC|nr:PREDICTED: mitoferrin [Theobroma cacao]